MDSIKANKAKTKEKEKMPDKKPKKENKKKPEQKKGTPRVVEEPAKGKSSAGSKKKK
jgi:hypothetical protein